MKIRLGLEASWLGSAALSALGALRGTVCPLQDRDGGPIVHFAVLTFTMSNAAAASLSNGPPFVSSVWHFTVFQCKAPKGPYVSQKYSSSNCRLAAFSPRRSTVRSILAPPVLNPPHSIERRLAMAGSHPVDRRPCRQAQPHPRPLLSRQRRTPIRPNHQLRIIPHPGLHVSHLH
jgi:hypothetical protein